MNDDGRRPRLYRRQSRGSERGSLAAFFLAFALIAVVMIALFVMMGAILPG